jgi:hypothetical protein
MPRYNNSFASPEYVQQTIKDSAGRTVGTIRLKPSGVLWKPAGQHQFYRVSLDDFANWMTTCSSASRCGS